MRVCPRFPFSVSALAGSTNTYECGVKDTPQGPSVRGNMKISLLRILTLTLLQTASVAAANPNQLSRVRFCMPHATRFTKCIENKVAECTRSRGINCKTDPALYTVVLNTARVPVEN